MVKNLPANAADASLIPGSGRSPGVGNGNPIPVFLPGKFQGLGISLLSHAYISQLSACSVTKKYFNWLIIFYFKCFRTQEGNEKKGLFFFFGPSSNFNDQIVF